MDLMERLVNASLEIQFPELSEATVSATKGFLIDTFGVAAAAAGSSEAQIVSALLQRWGGATESTPWFSRERVPAPNAALLNGTLVHSKEFDAIHPASVHPMSSVTAATLAVAEELGGISGRDFLAAIAVGVDVACRVGMGCKRGLSFYRPATCGAFGAVAACARLSELGPTRTMDAMGIVYSQLSGTLQSHAEGALVNTMQPGFAARSAVLSTNLAQQGMTGPHQVLEGPYGYFRLFEGDAYDTVPVLEDLGYRCEIENLSYKPFCTGRLANGAVEAAIRLSTVHELRQEEIERVTVTAPELNVRLVGRPAVRGSMTPQGARLSIPFCVSVALLRGDVWISDFEEAALEDEAVYDLASRIDVVVDPDNPDPQVMVPVYVDIRTSRSAFREEIKALKGSPESPLSDEERLAKFGGCWKYSGILSAARGERLVQLIDNLEAVRNVGELAGVLALSPD